MKESNSDDIRDEHGVANSGNQNNQPMVSAPGSRSSRGGRVRRGRRGSSNISSSIASSDGASFSSSTNSQVEKDPKIQVFYPVNSQEAQDKRKRDGRRRRKPKLRNKVDALHPSNSNSQNNGKNGKHSSNSRPSPDNSEGNKYSFGWNTTVCPASKGGPTSKKHHDAPMMKRDLYFALHCERVAIGAPGRNNSDSPLHVPSARSDAVARVTLINWENETILDTYVQVPVPVTNFYDSGIKPEDVSPDSPSAKAFAVVRQTVESTLKGKILIGHYVEQHLNALGLTHPWTDTRDCANFFKTKVGIGTDSNTNTSVVTLDMLYEEWLHRPLPPLSHAERPMQACVAALALYKANRKEWEEFLIAEARKIEIEQPEERLSLAKRERAFSYESSEQSSPMLRGKLGSTEGMNPNIMALHCVAVETTGGSKKAARVTVLNSFHQVVWDSYVQWQGQIVDGLGSSVFAQDLMAANGALPFPMVRHHVKRLLHGNLITGYKLDEAFAILGLHYPVSQIRDIAYFSPFMYTEMDGISGMPVVVDRSLDELCLEVLQKGLVPPEHRSRPLSVCNVVLELYEIYQDEWEQEIFSQQQERNNQDVHHERYSTQHEEPGHRKSSSSSSWFSWPKRQQPEAALPSQCQHPIQLPPGQNNAPLSVTLSARAFQALHCESDAPPTSSKLEDYSYYEGSAYVGGSSMFEGSSYHEPTLTSRFEDSSRGVLDSFTAGSVVSSIQDDTSSAAGELSAISRLGSSPNHKSSSWFRFGSRKSRYASPSSRDSMLAVQEQADGPPEMSAGAFVVNSSTNSNVVQEVPENEDHILQEDPPSSRSWFGFGRRSASPSRMTSNSLPVASSYGSPESPQSGPTVATSGSECDEITPLPRELNDDTPVNPVSVHVPTSTSPITSPLVTSTEGIFTSNPHETSQSWFGVRHSKSSRGASDASEGPVDISTLFESGSEVTIEPDVGLTTTEKTDTTDDDWLREVMSQSTGTGANDEVNSVGFASLLGSDTGVEETRSTNGMESRKSSRGQSSWFGLKRSKSRKSSRLASLSDAASENDIRESAHPTTELPDLVSIDKAKASPWIERDSSLTTSPKPAVSWYLDTSNDVSSKNGDVDDSVLSRSRLPTESTIPTVLTEEDDESGGAFAEEFEKGVAQSFAYLEI